MPLFDSFPLDTTFYDDVDVETLAKYVNIDALKSLQKTYRSIYRYNNSFLRVIGGIWANVSATKELIQQIEETIKVLKDREQ